MNNKRIVSLLLCVASIVLTGCWSRVEVNDISIVTAMAIDKLQDGQLLISLQIPVPSKLGPSGAGGSSGSSSATEQSTFIVSEKGLTIMDAYKRLEKKLSRRVFFAQLRLLIIGEEAARDGIQPLLDFFLRGNGARPRSYILVSKGMGADILKLSPALERYNTEVIREEENIGVGLRVTQTEFVDMLSRQGMAAVAAMVDKKKPDISNTQQSDVKNKETPAIEGTAVIRNGKLVGWLDEKETRGLLWMQDNMKRGVLTVQVSENRGGGKISVQLTDGRSRTRTVLDGYNVKFITDIRVKCELLENSSQLDASSLQDLSAIQTLLENDLNERIQRTVRKAQKMNADIFGFGSKIYESHPAVWNKQFKNEWDEMFPKLEVVIHSEATVVRTGLTNQNLKWSTK